MPEVTIHISDKILKIIAVIAAAWFVAGVALFIWKAGLFTPVYSIQVYVPESGGLARGAQVRLNGMPVGTVEAVNPAAAPASPTRMVQVTLRVQKRYQDYIRSTSTASINSLGSSGNAL
jgi:ABC-type transporter Mla subunit MlaD